MPPWRVSHFPYHRIFQVTAVPVRVRVPTIRAATTDTPAWIRTFRVIAALRLCPASTRIVTDIPLPLVMAPVTTATTTRTVAGTGVSSCSCHRAFGTGIQPRHGLPSGTDFDMKLYKGITQLIDPTAPRRCPGPPCGASCRLLSFSRLVSHYFLWQEKGCAHRTIGASSTTAVRPPNSWVTVGMTLTMDSTWVRSTTPGSQVSSQYPPGSVRQMRC